jgi:hypothetical protein
VKGWRNSTNPRTLQDLFHGGRTQSSDDDHGEGYPDTIDGPNLYQTVDLPVGSYVFSVYLCNDDAHAGGWNRFRDYAVELASTPELAAQIGRIGWYEKNHIQPAGAFSTSRPAAISRCEYFNGGVYKRFFVHVAPAGVRYRGLNMGCITLCIRRNYSLNAICEGLFIDRLGRLPRLGYRRGGSAGQPPIVVEKRPSVPAFKKGQPYIPADFGIPAPRPHVIFLPPPSIPRACYEAGAVMQQLLHLRRADGPWFSAVARPEVVVLARFLEGARVHGRPPAACFYKQFRQAIWNPRFLASLLRDAALQAAADRIYPPMSRYMPGQDEYWAWEKRTKNPKVTDQQIWPLPQVFKLYHAWWEKHLHQCLNWEDPQWAKN